MTSCSECDRLWEDYRRSNTEYEQLKKRQQRIDFITSENEIREYRELAHLVTLAETTCTVAQRSIKEHTVRAHQRLQWVLPRETNGNGPGKDRPVTAT